VLTAMTSTVAKRPAPNVPPKPAPRRRLGSDSTPDGAAVSTGNGSAGGHDVTSSSASSSIDEPMQVVAELPDGHRVALTVDARFVYRVARKTSHRWSQKVS